MRRSTSGTSFEIAAVDADVLTAALEVGSCGYKDAVLLEAARGANAAGIVTRNIQDFASADIPVFSPSELLPAVLASNG